MSVIGGATILRNDKIDPQVEMPFNIVLQYVTLVRRVRKQNDLVIGHERLPRFWTRITCSCGPAKLLNLTIANLIQQATTTVLAAIHETSRLRYCRQRFLERTCIYQKSPAVGAELSVHDPGPIDRAPPSMLQVNSYLL